MILSFLFDLVLSLSEWTIDLLPDITLPIDLAAYITPVADFVGYVDTFASISVIAFCISTILLVDNWALVVKLSIKIWELLPLT